MIIIIARDDTIRNWALQPESGSAAWGAVWAIPKQSNQGQATTALTSAINGLPVDEPVCVSGHGHNDEIGDENSGATDWGWNVNAFAGILAGVNVRTAPILFSTCATKVVNFSSQLALRLIALRAQKKAWVYGYNTALDVTARYPNPAKLSSAVDLQGTQVWW